jgi:hypothetical protein
MVFIDIFLLLLLISCLTFYSSKWVQQRLLTYYLTNDNYSIAVELRLKLTRKNIVLGDFNTESNTVFFREIDFLMEEIVERYISYEKKHWDESKTFFIFDGLRYFQEIDTLFDRSRIIIGNHLVDEFYSLTKFHEYYNSKKPYPTQLGFLDNDFNPALGILENFNYSGGFALDCRLRSIGANLASKKPVVAIRLRRWNKETRVKPENLSIWISDDNKVFRKYSGKITFSNESRAMTIDHLDIVGQFIKIHCDYKDERFTFAEYFNNILEIYGPPLVQHN